MPEYQVPSITELYETILERSHPALPGFEALVSIRAIKRAGRIHDYLKARDRRRRIRERIWQLGHSLKPMTMHPDIRFRLINYDFQEDIMHADIFPRCPYNWAKVAYQYSKQPGMKYDQPSRYYRIDGQPRVSQDGWVWVRYITDFEDGSRVTLAIRSKHPSEGDAEDQLLDFYWLFKERDGLNPYAVLMEYTSE